MPDPEDAEDLLDVFVQHGVERRSVDELPPPLTIAEVRRVEGGYSLELSDGRTLFLAQGALDRASPDASSRR